MLRGVSSTLTRTEAWIWDLLEAAPMPEKARRLKRSRIEKILRTHRIRRLSAEQVEAAFDVQGFELGPGSVAAASDYLCLLLPVLRLLHGQRKEIAKRMEAALAGDLVGPGGYVLGLDRD